MLFANTSMPIDHVCVYYSVHSAYCQAARVLETSTNVYFVITCMIQLTFTLHLYLFHNHMLMRTVGHPKRSLQSNRKQ
jgi:hypothetical protein